MSGVVFLNPKSGPDETGAAELRQRFPGHRVEECKPGDLPQRVKEAVADHVSFVAVAGGDGTIRCAAEQMTGSDVPLLPVPAGTRNHFSPVVRGRSRWLRDPPPPCRVVWTGEGVVGPWGGCRANHRNRAVP